MQQWFSQGAPFPEVLPSRNQFRHVHMHRTVKYCSHPCASFSLLQGNSQGELAPFCQHQTFSGAELLCIEVREAWCDSTWDSPSRMGQLNPVGEASASGQTALDHISLSCMLQSLMGWYFYYSMFYGLIIVAELAAAQQPWPF